MHATAALIAAAGALALGGCAALGGPECASRDWRAIGREDGASGVGPAAVEDHARRCRGEPVVAAYRAGLAAGLEEFCRAGNGFAAGAAGQAMHEGCAARPSAAYLEGYAAGRQRFEVEAALRDLARRIDGLHRQVDAVDDALGDAALALVTGGDIETARTRGRALAAERQRLRSELAALEDEQAARVAELAILETRVARGD